MSTGENLPSAFGALKTELGEAASDSNKLLRAFLFTTLCVMGGAMGAATLEGCMFLDAERGRQVAMAIEAIGDLTGDPVEIFWTYVASRASQLGLAVPESVEEKTLARLACITRCVSREELTALKAHWFSMSTTNRSFLCSRLVADGISDQGFVFEKSSQHLWFFLPP